MKKALAYIAAVILATVLVHVLGGLVASFVCLDNQMNPLEWEPEYRFHSALWSVALSIVAGIKVSSVFEEAQRTAALEEACEESEKDLDNETDWMYNIINKSRK